MLELSINRNQLQAQNVDMQAVFKYLQTYLGSNFVNQFVLEIACIESLPKQKRIIVLIPKILTVFTSVPVRADIPLSGLVSVKRFTYPPIITNFNLYPSINVQGNPAPGLSTGTAIAVMEDVCRQSPPASSYAWTGTAFQEKTSAGACPSDLGFSLYRGFPRTSRPSTKATSTRLSS
jgi:multidrug efflux pump subunit AcrB